MESTERDTKGALKNQSAFSLICLFQILTACCIFFTCLKASPLLAVIGTIIVAPAIIRTGVASEIYRNDGKVFGWKSRLRFFIGSIGVVLLTITIASAAFALISMAFGLFCVGLAALVGYSDLLRDIAFLGTLGGMIWGAAGSMVAICYCAKKSWVPAIATTP